MGPSKTYKAGQYLYEQIDRCRCCGKAWLTQYLDLGYQPLANEYSKTDSIIEKRFPLKVNLCENCFHSQLSIVVNPDLIFKEYLYVSGTTWTLHNHFKLLAEDAMRRVGQNHPMVLDIACNDGTLLQKFKAFGAEVYGVDPAKNLRKITTEKNLNVIVDYWNSETAKRLSKRFDIITATNVFAHVDNIQEFLITCMGYLNPDGIIILEFPYCNELIVNNEFDTIYHEHLSYFLVNSFSFLADSVGLIIDDIITTSIHGGSIRFFLKLSKEYKRYQTDTQLAYIEKERKAGLLEKKTYEKFSRNIVGIKYEILNVLSKFDGMGIPVVGYGASAKGNTMLNYIDSPLKYIVDDNPLKYGHFTPGQHIPIVETKILSTDKSPLAIVILSWNFYDEIKQKILERRRGLTTYLIRYIPKVEAEEL